MFECGPFCGISTWDTVSGSRTVIAGDRSAEHKCDIDRDGVGTAATIVCPQTGVFARGENAMYFTTWSGGAGLGGGNR